MKQCTDASFPVFTVEPHCSVFVAVFTSWFPAALFVGVFLLSPLLPTHTGDGKCVVCDSHTRPTTIVRVCDECTAGSLASQCVTCGGVGVSDAYYCAACTMLEKDRDGCPTIVNVGTAKADAFWANKKFGKGGGR